MESLDSAACFMDDLLDLDFGSDIEDDEEEKQPRKAAALPSLNPNGLNVLHPDDPGRSFPEGLEEELEWISNKDSFPPVETFVDIVSDNPGSLAKQQSPVSVLENSTTSSNSNSNSTNGSSIMSCCGNLRVPVRARSKRRRKRRRDLSAPESWWRPENVRNVRQAAVGTVVIGRKCLHCGAEKTPQWRAGPFGPKTLCNACGVRYKSGRLVPEYRPASSPTFSNKLHSNSHRKIVEMRKQKQVMGMVVVKPMDKG